jgi:hypothetical protein
MIENQDASSMDAPNSDIKEYLQKLLAKSGSIFDHSTTVPNSRKIAASHIFASEMGVWCKVLSQRREVDLLKVAILEYEFALLALL